MIKIGTTSHVILNVLFRNNSDANDYGDANWLTTELSVKTDVWFGKYNANLRTEEFLDLKNNLEILYDIPDHDFKFDPMEPWLIMDFKGNKLGQIEIEGEACDKLGQGDKLQFSFSIDQSYLPEIIRNLQNTIKEFPIKGNP